MILNNFIAQKGSDISKLSLILFLIFLDLFDCPYLKSKHRKSCKHYLNVRTQKEWSNSYTESHFKNSKFTKCWDFRLKLVLSIAMTIALVRSSLKLQNRLNSILWNTIFRIKFHINFNSYFWIFFLIKEINSDLALDLITIISVESIAPLFPLPLSLHMSIESILNLVI